MAKNFEVNSEDISSKSNHTEINLVDLLKENIQEDLQKKVCALPQEARLGALTAVAMMDSKYTIEQDLAKNYALHIVPGITVTTDCSKK